MIARFVRAAAAAAAIVIVAITAAPAAEPSPNSTPSTSYLPVPAPSPSIDPGWIPAPGTAAYDPNAPKPSAVPQPAATSAVSTVDGRKIDGHGHKTEITPGLRSYELTRDDSYLDPLSWSVSAFKSRHELVVYYKGHMYQVYHAVFGRNRGNGTKLWEGDRRTPEGVYTIIEKHPSRRWEWFLGLNYPNDVDRYRYGQMRDAQEVPVEAGHDVGEGGHIGIHGTDNPVLNSGNIDWTTGCISVNNQDIDELDRILPLGTVIIINP